MSLVHPFHTKNGQGRLTSALSFHFILNLYWLGHLSSVSSFHFMLSFYASISTNCLLLASHFGCAKSFPSWIKTILWLLKVYKALLIIDFPHSFPPFCIMSSTSSNLPESSAPLAMRTRSRKPNLSFNADLPAHTRQRRTAVDSVTSTVAAPITKKGPPIDQHESTGHMDPMVVGSVSASNQTNPQHGGGSVK
jgi:hypothetical protein